MMEAGWIPWSVAATLCGGVWFGCRWWYRRRLAALTLHLEKVDRARQHAIQQGLQARKQVEKLQKEMSEIRRASSHAALQRGRERQLEAVLGNATPDPTEVSDAPAAPPHGFADTLPM